MSRDPTIGSIPDLSRLRQCFRCRCVFVVHDLYEDGCPSCDNQAKHECPNAYCCEGSSSSKGGAR